MSAIIGNIAMTLVAHPAMSSPKAPRKVRRFVLLRVNPALVVGEPNDRASSLLSLPVGELLFRHSLDAEFLLAIEIGAFEVF